MKLRRRYTSRSCGIPVRPFFLLKILVLEDEPFWVAETDSSSREKIFQTRQPDTHSKVAPVRLLPGMRSSRGSRNSPSPAVITFADQMPAQIGIVPARASPAPIVNIR